MHKLVRVANLADFNAIQGLDQQVATNGLNRSIRIMQAIHENSCYASISKSYIQGFALFKREAFRQMDFLDQLVVNPTFRRQGVGSALINHFRENATTEFCWTSTNASNTQMICLLKKLNWIDSEYREDLDPGDPDMFFYIKKST